MAMNHIRLSTHLKEKGILSVTPAIPRDVSHSSFQASDRERVFSISPVLAQEVPKPAMSSPECKVFAKSTVPEPPIGDLENGNESYSSFHTSKGERDLGVTPAISRDVSHSSFQASDRERVFSISPVLAQEVPKPAMSSSECIVIAKSTVPEPPIGDLENGNESYSSFHTSEGERDLSVTPAISRDVSQSSFQAYDRERVFSISPVLAQEVPKSAMSSSECIVIAKSTVPEPPIGELENGNESYSSFHTSEGERDLSVTPAISRDVSQSSFQASDRERVFSISPVLAQEVPKPAMSSSECIVIAKSPVPEPPIGELENGNESYSSFHTSEGERDLSVTPAISRDVSDLSMPNMNMFNADITLPKPHINALENIFTESYSSFEISENGDLGVPQDLVHEVSELAMLSSNGNLGAKLTVPESATSDLDNGIVYSETYSSFRTSDGKIDIGVTHPMVAEITSKDNVSFNSTVSKHEVIDLEKGNAYNESYSCLQTYDGERVTPMFREVSELDVLSHEHKSTAKATVPRPHVKVQPAWTDIDDNNKEHEDVVGKNTENTQSSCLSRNDVKSAVTRGTSCGENYSENNKREPAASTLNHDGMCTISHDKASEEMEDGTSSQKNKSIFEQLKDKKSTITKKLKGKIPKRMLDVKDTVLSPKQFLEEKVKKYSKDAMQSFVNKTGISDKVQAVRSRVVSVVPKGITDKVNMILEKLESSEDEEKDKEGDQSGKEEDEDGKKGVTDIQNLGQNKLKRAMCVISTLTIIMCFFSSGVAIVKVSVINPEKAVSQIVSTFWHMLSNITMIVPAILGLVFTRIQNRLQQKKPPTILKCCVPVHLGFSITCIVLGTIAMVSSISGVKLVCSVGECSEEQVLVIGLEIVHIGTAIMNIGASIFGVVYSCKTRTILFKVLPIRIVTKKLQILKEKTPTHLHIGKGKEKEKIDGEANMSKDGIADDDLPDNLVDDNMEETRDAIKENSVKS